MKLDDIKPGMKVCIPTTKTQGKLDISVFQRELVRKKYTHPYLLVKKVFYGKTGWDIWLDLEDKPGKLKAYSFYPTDLTPYTGE